MTNHQRDQGDLLLRRTAAVAADYKALQGIGGVVFGVGLALIALQVTIVGVLLLLCAAPVSQAWYRRRFGQVSPYVDRLPVLLMSLAFVMVLYAGYSIDLALGAPILALPLGVAVYAAVSHRFAYPHIGVTRAHQIVLVLLALSSLLPLLGVPASSGAAAGLLALAAAQTTIGVVDHRRLVGAMRPVPDA
jgi:hypothetical protein